MKIAIYPGSFDPITTGHLNIIERASKIFDRLIVCAMVNAGKRSPMFTHEERVEFIRRVTAHLPNVEVISATGRLIDLVDRLGCDVIVKGVRNAVDFAYEQEHALYNRAHNPRAETLYLPADPAFDGVSSTLAREKMMAGEDLSGILPERVMQWINAHKRA